MAGEPEASSVPLPTRRWKTRALVPLLGVGVALVLLGYSAREAVRPALAVEVAPVIAGEIEEARPAGAVVAQATGWIEPDPFPITVAARRDGLVEEVLVMEGDPVEAGQVVARLSDEDERNALREAEAQLEKVEAELEELNVELVARRTAVESELISPVQVELLESRLRAREADVKIAAARRDRAALAVERSRVTSLSSGVVMTRLVEPGGHLGAARARGEGPGALRLYDPSRLQVRVDVPLARAGQIGLGNEAEIVAEVLPDSVFQGRVTRVMQEADISRNTLQFKVAIDDPSPELKPEMTARVRILAAAGLDEAEDGRGMQRVFAPVSLVGNEAGTVSVWVADQNHRAVRREATLGQVRRDEWIEVASGLRPGDRIIANPPARIREGRRLEVTETAGEGVGRLTNPGGSQ